MIKHFTSSPVLILTALLIPFAAAHAAEYAKPDQIPTEGISATIGLQFESGDYGTAYTTDTWGVLLDMSYLRDQFYYGINTTYLSAESSGNVVISGSSGGKRQLSSSTRSSVSGLGDINLYAGYLFPPQDSTNYRLTAQLKLPTADEAKGLGTGETDLSIEAGLLTKLPESKRLFAGVGYQLSGDSPVTDYENIFFGHVGISVERSPRQRLGAMLEYIQAATPGFDDALELTGFFDIGLANQDSLYFYALLGLTDGSPDFGAGIHYRFYH